MGGAAAGGAQSPELPADELPLDSNKCVIIVCGLSDHDTAIAVR